MKNNNEKGHFKAISAHAMFFRSPFLVTLELKLHKQAALNIYCFDSCQAVKGVAIVSIKGKRGEYTCKLKRI